MNCHRPNPFVNFGFSIAAVAVQIIASLQMQQEKQNNYPKCISKKQLSGMYFKVVNIRRM
jgi:hypothetical protein